jgi:hypothetical protein
MDNPETQATLDMRQDIPKSVKTQVVASRSKQEFYLLSKNLQAIYITIFPPTGNHIRSFITANEGRHIRIINSL